jgi:hypothetical protein
MTRGSLALLLACPLLLIGAHAVNAQQIPAAQERAQAQAPNASGHIGGPPALAPQAVTSVPVCLVLNPGGVEFNFKLQINGTYPYTITGGTITGSLCNAANWTVTGGHLSSTLQILAKYNGPPGCASTMNVTGNYNNPSAYIGTYGFGIGNQPPPNTPFPHDTLFIGYYHSGPPC